MTALQPIAQEILAWRGWSLVDEPIRLKSLSHATIWDGPSFTADKAPSDAEDNTHGVYALANESGSQVHVTSYGIYPMGSYRDSAVVWGQVALSGVVVCGSSGYRAERAVIRSLRILQHYPPTRTLLEIACALEDRYECDVVIDDAAIQPPHIEPTIEGWLRGLVAKEVAAQMPKQSSSFSSYVPNNYPAYPGKIWYSMFGSA